MFSTKKFYLNIITCIFIAWMSFTLSVFLHEYTHSLVAWLLGFKTTPFDIDYGHFGWSNIVWQQVDQAVNNPAIDLIGHRYQAGIIPIIPPILINGGFGLGVLFHLEKRLKQEKERRFLNIFLFTFVLWNVGEFFNYTCLRSFSTHADVGLFLHYFQLSPWVIFIPGFYVSLFAFYRILSPLCRSLFQRYALKKFSVISIYLTTCFILFVFQPLIGFRFDFFRFNPTVTFVNILCLLVAPIMSYAFWPRSFLACRKEEI